MVKFSTYFFPNDTVMVMAEKPADRKNAEATRKGTKKVNLGELQGRINKRGRERFTDPVLAESFRAMLADGEPFIWLDAQPVGKTEAEINTSKAKWRSRAVSVFRSLNTDKKLSVAWTTDNEMVLMLKA